jgi:hypothetical protein
MAKKIPATHEKVYDLTGKEHVMPLLNARDMVQHLKWTRSPPVVVYRDKPAMEAAPESDDQGDGTTTVVVKSAAAPVDDAEGDEGDDNSQADAEVPDFSGGSDAPTFDASNMSKDDILKYAEDHYSTKLDGRKAQMTLALELSKLVDNLG